VHPAGARRTIDAPSSDSQRRELGRLGADEFVNKKLIRIGG
jgi:hypothetical protein